MIEPGEPIHCRLLERAGAALLAGHRSAEGRAFRSFLASVLGCVTLGLLLTGPAAARAMWTAPVNISRAEPSATEPEVAMDPRGDAVAVWEDSTSIRASSRRAGGSWQAPLSISKAGASPPSESDVAMDPQGDAVAVWQRGAANGFEEIQVAFRPAGGSWQAPVTLSEDARGQQRLQVVMDSRGDAFAVWGGMETIQATFRPIGGSWQKTESFAEGGYNPGLAVNSKGDAVAIWIVQSITSTSISYAIQSALRPAGGSWQAPVTLSEAVADGENFPSVATDPDGDVVAVWEGFEHFGVLQSALRPAGASWQQTEHLFTAAPYKGAEDPQVATDSHGDAVVVGLGSNGSHDTIRAVARPTGASWQAPVTLSEVEGAFPSRPQLAMDPRGDAVAVWASYKGSGTKGLIESAIRPAGESWQAPTTIATVNLKQFEGEHGGTETAIPYPRVAIDSQGEAVAVWYDYTGSEDIAQAALITLAAPLTQRPSITHPSESQRRWREGEKLAQISGKESPPIGTVFSFELNEQASVSFSFTHKVGGREIGRTCLAETRRNRKRKLCTRTVTAGALTFTGHSAINSVVFQGRISRSQTLPPGRYALVITATNASGERSRPKRLSFTIIE